MSIKPGRNYIDMWRHQSIIKNYASYVINWIRSLAAKTRRRLEGVHLIRASSHKLQAASLKLQSLKPQATSIKRRGTSLKLQAASNKLLDNFSLIKFHVSRSEVLDYDKTIVRMPHMEGNLVW